MARPRPDPGSGRGAGPVEAVEDAGELVGGDAGAVVADLDHDAAAAVLAGGDGGGGALGGVRAHVGEQVVDGPAQQFLVADGRPGRARCRPARSAAGSAIRARSTHSATRALRSTGSAAGSGCWSRRASRSMSSTSPPIRWASSVIRRIASSTWSRSVRAPCWYSSALARSEASGVRSSWLASAKNRPDQLLAGLAFGDGRLDAGRASRSAPRRAGPPRFRSRRADPLGEVAGGDPSAWPAIISIGRRPRRMTRRRRGR